MKEHNQRKYDIELNGPRARANLKILTLLYPAWGIFLPFLIVVVGRGDRPYQLQALAPFTFYLALLYRIP